MASPRPSANGLACHPAGPVIGTFGRARGGTRPGNLAGAAANRFTVT